MHEPTDLDNVDKHNDVTNPLHEGLAQPPAGNVTVASEPGNGHVACL